MAVAQRTDIITLEETIAHHFQGDVERTGNITETKVTRETSLGLGRRAVFQEDINPNGSPNGSYRITTIDNSVSPPKVLSVSVGSELGIQACVSQNEAVATEISARQEETWHGYGGETGRAVVRQMVQILNAPLYQM